MKFLQVVGRIDEEGQATRQHRVHVDAAETPQLLCLESKLTVHNRSKRTPSKNGTVIIGGRLKDAIEMNIFNLNGPLC